MASPSSPVGTGERVVRTAAIWLRRAAGLGLFALGIAYWVRLVGVFPGPNWRFDLMVLEWRVAASALAVLGPVAGVGLWVSASWGVVVWVIVVALEVAMRVALPGTFGGMNLETSALLAGLVVVAALRVVEWSLRARRRRRPASG